MNEHTAIELASKSIVTSDVDDTWGFIGHGVSSLVGNHRTRKRV